MTDGAGRHLFWRRCAHSWRRCAHSWRRYAPFLAQVGFWVGDLRHRRAQNHDSRRRSPPFFLTCAKTPLHLRQNTLTPAPTIDLTCDSHHVQARLVQRNGLQAQIPCTSLSGKVPKRPIDALFEHETAL